MEISPRSVHSLVLAAGKGSRMKSNLPKPLVPLEGKPLLGYLLDALEVSAVAAQWVVVGHQGDLVKEFVGDRAACVWQPERLGTAHAVECALPRLPESCDDLLVFVGDSPLIRPQTIQRLVQRHHSTRAACAFLTATFGQHFPYARVITEQDQLVKVVEERDATEAEKEVREYLSSHFIFQKQALDRFIPLISPHPRTAERYLTDAIDLLMEAGETVTFEKIDDYRELVGLNTPQDLAWAAQLLQNDPQWA